jgi:hypothetical protein
MNESPQFYCQKCGSGDFKSDTPIVCLPDFIGAICQRCGTIVTRQDTDAEIYTQIEKVIEEIIGRHAQTYNKKSLFDRMFRRTSSPV